MFISKINLIATLIAYANSRQLFEKQNRPYFIIENWDKNAIELLKEPMSEEPQLFERDNVETRVRRQAQSNIKTNIDGTFDVGVKIPLAGDYKNKLSAIGSIGRASGYRGYNAGGGLAWDNANGYGASLQGKRILNFANQLIASGKVKLFHNDKHDVTAQAFATRTLPDNPYIPNFNTYSGKVGYTYDNRIGASLGMEHTDLFEMTVFSAMSKLSLFRDGDNSLDANAGFRRIMSPYINKWKPSGGLWYTRVI